MHIETLKRSNPGNCQVSYGGPMCFEPGFVTWSLPWMVDPWFMKNGSTCTTLEYVQTHLDNLLLTWKWTYDKHWQLKVYCISIRSLNIYNLNKPVCLKMFEEPSVTFRPSLLIICQKLSICLCWCIPSVKNLWHCPRSRGDATLMCLHRGDSMSMTQVGGMVGSQGMTAARH